MKLGLLTAPFPETPLMEVADWAAANEFEMLEVCAWLTAAGASRRYSGTCHIDVDDLSEVRAKAIVDELANRGIALQFLRRLESDPNPDRISD